MRSYIHVYFYQSTWMTKGNFLRKKKNKNKKQTKTQLYSLNDHGIVKKMSSFTIFVMTKLTLKSELSELTQNLYFPRDKTFSLTYLNEQ